jgi:hypothetical protein
MRGLGDHLTGDPMTQKHKKTGSKSAYEPKGITWEKLKELFEGGSRGAYRWTWEKEVSEHAMWGK